MPVLGAQVRAGFYGSYSGIIGWICSAGLAAQITVVRGGPEVFGGESRMVGISVDTIGAAASRG